MLRNANILTEGKNPYTEVYRLDNGRIFKYLKPPVSNNFVYQQNYAWHYNMFCGKLKKRDSLTEIVELVLPEEVTINQKGFVKGYYTPTRYEKNIKQLLEEDRNIELVTNYFEDLCDAIEVLHQNEIVVPDLITEENVLYDPTNRKILFIDYDGMQVGNTPTNAISSKLCYKTNSVLRTSKYRSSNGLYTNELDNLSLITGYFYHITGINLASLLLFQELALKDEKDKEYLSKIYDFFENIGIHDYEIINSFINYFQKSKNEIKPKKLIKAMSSKYKYDQKTKKFICT
jgi:serine/threonine protein kinase